MTLPLNFSNWLLAIGPVLFLISGILFFKWEAAKVGAFAWFIALFISYFFFGTDFRMLALANAKGLQLSLYVLLIIWGAVFLYNIADEAEAIEVIGKSMTRVTGNKSIMVLLLAWCFTSILQGLTGFGIPVAVVAPIMAIMGFEPVTAVAICLIGHSWAISFGSMGSSYNSIQLVTGIPGELIGPWMAVLFSLAILSTGFGVAHIYGGWSEVKKSAPYIITAGATISFVLWFMNIIGVPQLSVLIAGAAGTIVLVLWAILGEKQIKSNGESPGGQVNRMSFNLAFAPYYALVGISILTQIGFIKTKLSSFYWALDYPQAQTAYGYVVEAVKDYSKIVIFSHPAPILLISSAFGFFIYLRLGLVNFSSLKKAADRTADRCIPTSVGIATMVMMALIMSDSGMTQIIAQGVASVFGAYFPLVSPFIGTLGSFIMGSNTNSNVMFGLLQTNTAKVIGKSAVLMAAAQSVGGSLGVAITPSTIMTGAANVGLGGRENEIMKVTLKYCLFNVALVGIFVYILSFFVTV